MSIFQFMRAASLVLALLVAAPAWATFNLSIVVDSPQAKPNSPGGVSFTGAILLSATGADQGLSLRGFDIGRLEAVPLPSPNNNITAGDVAFTYQNGTFSNNVQLVLNTFVHGDISNQSVGTTPRQIARFTATISDPSKVGQFAFNVTNLGFSSLTRTDGMIVTGLQFGGSQTAVVTAIPEPGSFLYLSAVGVVMCLGRAGWRRWRRS